MRKVIVDNICLVGNGIRADIYSVGLSLARLRTSKHGKLGAVSSRDTVVTNVLCSAIQLKAIVLLYSVGA